MSVYHDVRIMKGWVFTSDEYHQLIAAYPKWESRFFYNGHNEYIYGIHLYEACEDEIVSLHPGTMVMSYVDTSELYNLQADCANAGLDAEHDIFVAPIKLYLVHGVFY